MQLLYLTLRIIRILLLKLHFYLRQQRDHVDQQHRRPRHLRRRSQHHAGPATANRQSGQTAPHSGRFRT